MRVEILQKGCGYGRSQGASEPNEFTPGHHRIIGFRAFVSPTMRLFAVAAVLALGCTSAAQPTASPSPDFSAQPTVTPDHPVATPTQTAKLIPSFEITPTPDTSPRVVKTPTPDPTASPPPGFVDGLEASNLFWDNFFETCWFGAFDIVSSLREITASSDLVVRGTLVDLHGIPRNDSDPPWEET
jgi:hypothetical protein